MQKLKEIYQNIYADATYEHTYLPLVKRCDDTKNIPKVENAGKVVSHNGNNVILMHNGVMVHEGSYHGQWMSDVIEYLQGHHEPQEEKLFYEILKHIEPNSTMIECGSFWSYYSLWFNKQIENAKNYMIEPNPHKCELGKMNFELNNFEGTFLNGCIGDTYIENYKFSDWDHKIYEMPMFSIDWLVENYKIKKISVLHADIQLHEMELLNGAENSFQNNLIDFLFLGTHTPNRPFIKKIELYGYKIINSFEVSESFFDDGLVLACSESIYNNLDLSNFTISKKR